MSIPNNLEPVLDKGYVRYIKHMGSDLDVVNAARASFAKESTELSERDKSLIRYLIRKNEYAPFRHSAVTFEVKAPLMVARQWWKYHVASQHTESQDGWSEQSKRYVTAEPEFYIPAEWRHAPDNAKQGSGDRMSIATELAFRSAQAKQVEDAMELHAWALDCGAAPEQARLFLPANAQYTTWRWTISLDGLLHFLRERLGHGAQSEITEYAEAVRRLSGPLFPFVFMAVFGLE